MLRTVSLSLVLAAALPSAAGAQTLQNVLAEAGVLGVWANDCSRPPGNGNIYTTYATGASGEVTVTYEHGARYTPTVNRILSARQIAPERVAYSQQNRASGAQIDIVINVSATHLRVWSSIRSDGQALVREGKFISDGVESPLQARCK